MPDNIDLIEKGLVKKDLASQDDKLNALEIQLAVAEKKVDRLIWWYFYGGQLASAVALGYMLLFAENPDSHDISVFEWCYAVIMAGGLSFMLGYAVFMFALIFSPIKGITESVFNIEKQIHQRKLELGLILPEKDVSAKSMCTKLDGLDEQVKEMKTQLDRVEHLLSSRNEVINPARQALPS